VIPQKGRNRDERSFVLIERGIYKGFGYIDLDQQICSLEELKEFLILQPDNRDIQRILRGFKTKNEDKYMLLEEVTGFGF
jgi:DNA polymerase-3 subunit epsilon